LTPNCFFLLALTCTCISAFGNPFQDPIQFVECAEEKGLHFIQHSGSKDKHYIVEAKGAGVTVADVNNDGWDDIYLVNGASLTKPISDDSPRNQLFLNQGDGTFRNATEESGLGDRSLGISSAFADIDNDGDLDCYIANYGPNALYLNDGNAHFTPVENAGGAQNPGMSTGIAFADVTGDGYLDLYLGQYAEFSKELADQQGTMMDYYGMKAFLGPRYFPPSRDQLYINNGDGTFRDESELRGINAIHSGRAFTVMFTDLENDGDLDIYVSNDTTANHLYENNGQGRFEEIALLSGTALSEHGQAQGGMGLAIEDYDNDMNMDIAVANYEAQYNILYQNLGQLMFSDVSFTSGFYEGSVPYVSFGLIMEDFNNDGWRDAHVATGHVYPQVDQLKDKKGYAQSDLFYLNQQDGTYRLLETHKVLSGEYKGVSRGSAYSDFDQDGDLDLVINNLDSRLYYFENRSQSGNYLQVRLLNEQGMPAFGSQLTLQTNSLSLRSELRSSSSFLSQSSATLHFGLGKESQVKQLQIRWLDGSIQILENVDSNQRVTIRKEDKQP